MHVDATDMTPVLLGAVTVTQEYCVVDPGGYNR